MEIESTATSWPHSCSHCRKTVLDPERNHVNGHILQRLSYTRREAFLAAKDGCIIYRFLLRGLLEATAPESLIGFLNAFKDAWRSEPKQEYEKHEMLNYAQSFSERPFIVHFTHDAGRWYVHFMCYGWSSDSFWVTARPGAPLGRFFSIAKPINRDVASDAAFELARDWLKACTGEGATTHEPSEWCTKHSRCATEFNPTILPSRLLEIVHGEETGKTLDGSSTNSLKQSQLGRDHSYTVKLRHTTPGERLKYACLSYCWGQTQRMKTTRANVAARADGIRSCDLPKTLQDAILVSHRLGIQYIWIDALTILQDDPHDLATELAKMPEIFKNAYVTISASSAAHCDEGFLSPRRPLKPGLTRPVCEDFTLRAQNASGAVGDLCFFADDTPFWFQGPAIDPTLEPVKMRAWTLQEHLLSPRILDYSSRNLRWQCASWNCFDGGWPPEDPESSEPIINIPHVFMDPERAILGTWRHLVMDYSKRLLTFPGDKLVAIAALAREFGQNLKTPYHAGLWRDYIAEQLCWSVEPEDLRPRPKEYRAPSWSWAAIDGKIEDTMESSSVGTGLKVLNCETEPVNPSLPFGAVKSGSITLQGLLVTAVWFAELQGSLVHRQRDGSVIILGSFSPYSPPEPTTLLSKSARNEALSNKPPATPTTDEMSALLPEQNRSSAVIYLDTSDDQDLVEPGKFVQEHILLLKPSDGLVSLRGLIIRPIESGQAGSFKRVSYINFVSTVSDIHKIGTQQIITLY